MSIQDQELMNEMVAESRDHLKTIEPDLLALEKDGNRVPAELVNRVFRALHSIKGGVMFFGLKKMGTLAHTMENLLSDIREKRVSVTPNLVDALFSGCDKLVELLDDPENSNDKNIEAELQAFVPFGRKLEQESTTTVAKTSEGISANEFIKIFSELTHQDISGPKAVGKFFFAIHVGSQKNKEDNDKTLQNIREELEKLGDVLSLNESEKKDDKDWKADIAFSSVLDRSFLETVIQLPNGGLRELEKKALDSEESSKDDKSKTVEKHKAKMDETIRVKVSLLDQLVSLAGEMVLSRNQLLRKTSLSMMETDEFGEMGAIINKELDNCLSCCSIDSEKTEIESRLEKVRQLLQTMMSRQVTEFPGFKPVIQNMDTVTANLQESIMGMRMQPVSTIFSKFPRVIRDISKKLGKQIALRTVGDDVELDKTLIELLADPLTHLIRNSADHGIEMPDKRNAAGKDPLGTVVLRAYHESGKVNIEIEDDGDGMDSDILIEKAVEKKIITQEEAEKMSKAEALNLIFRAGFSTATAVGELSGRGVGMDVVRTNIEKLNGHIEIESEKGKGTKVALRLPLTLAIIPSIIVSKGKDRFALPQVGLDELVRVRPEEIKGRLFRIQDADVLRLRDSLLPLVRISDVLGRNRKYQESDSEEILTDRREYLSDRRSLSTEVEENTENATRSGKERREEQAALKIIVLKTGQNLFGLVVDEVYDIEEIVVQPLSSYLQGIDIFAGSAIMGDGSVAMILDPTGISSSMKLQFGAIEQAVEGQQLSVEVAMRQGLLLFSMGKKQNFALNLELVERIEKVRADSLQRAGGKEFMTYDKESLQLINLQNHLNMQEEPRPEWIYIIVPKLVKHPLGLIVNEVTDINYSALEIDSESLNAPGILGSTLIDGKLTIMLDLYGLFELADPEHYSHDDATTSLKNKRILYAEDTSFFRTVVTDYLESFGCEIKTAIDGEKGWDLLNQEKFDLVLTDIEMPSLNGYQLAEKIKTSEEFKTMPIIAMTSLDESRFQRQGGSKDRFFDGYEHKLDKDHLKKTLEEFL